VLLLLFLATGRVRKALDDGSYVLAWLTFSDLANSGTLLIEHFDPMRGVFEEPLVLGGGPILGALMALNGAGKGVVVWLTGGFDAQGQPIPAAGHMTVVRVTR
jgi:hypothetical protein